MTTTLVDAGISDLGASTSEDKTGDLRKAAIDRISFETGSTDSEASDMLDWLMPIVKRAREDKKGLTYPTEVEMNTVEYDLFDMVMPHGSHSALGSAHHAIEALLLDQSRSEYSMIHDTRETGTLTYCTVQVLLRVF